MNQNLILSDRKSKKDLPGISHIKNQTSESALKQKYLSNEVQEQIKEYLRKDFEVHLPVLKLKHSKDISYIKDFKTPKVHQCPINLPTNLHDLKNLVSCRSVTNFDHLCNKNSCIDKILSTFPSVESGIEYLEKIDAGPPSGRKEAENLLLWFCDMKNKYENHESFELVVKTCIEELIRQITVECKERGELLKTVLGYYQQIYAAKDLQNEKITAKKEQDCEKLIKNMKNQHKEEVFALNTKILQLSADLKNFNEASMESQVAVGIYKKKFYEMQKLYLEERKKKKNFLSPNLLNKKKVIDFGVNRRSFANGIIGDSLLADENGFDYNFESLGNEVFDSQRSSCVSFRDHVTQTECSQSKKSEYFCFDSNKNQILIDPIRKNLENISEGIQTEKQIFELFFEYFEIIPHVNIDIFNTNKKNFSFTNDYIEIIPENDKVICNDLQSYNDSVTSPKKNKKKAFSEDFKISLQNNENNVENLKIPEENLSENYLDSDKKLITKFSIQVIKSGSFESSDEELLQPKISYKKGKSIKKRRKNSIIAESNFIKTDEVSTYQDSMNPSQIEIASVDQILLEKRKELQDLKEKIEKLEKFEKLEESEILERLEKLEKIENIEKIEKLEKLEKIKSIKTNYKQKDLHENSLKVGKKPNKLNNSFSQYSYNNSVRKITSISKTKEKISSSHKQTTQSPASLNKNLSKSINLSDSYTQDPQKNEKKVNSIVFDKIKTLDVLKPADIIFSSPFINKKRNSAVDFYDKINQLSINYNDRSMLKNNESESDQSFYSSDSSNEDSESISDQNSMNADIMIPIPSNTKKRDENLSFKEKTSFAEFNFHSSSYKAHNSNSAARVIKKLLMKSEKNIIKKALLTKTTVKKIINSVYQSFFSKLDFITSDRLIKKCYEDFIQKYGLKKVSNRKTAEFFASLIKHRKAKKCRIFLQLAGYGEVVNKNNYSNLTLLLYLKLFNRILSDKTGLVFNNNDVKAKCWLNRNRIIEFIRMKLDDKIGASLMNPLIASLDRKSPAKNKTNDGIDLDEVLEQICIFYEKALDLIKKGLNLFFLAFGYLNTEKIFFDEFLIAVRAVFPQSFQKVWDNGYKKKKISYEKAFVMCAEANIFQEQGLISFVKSFKTDVYKNYTELVENIESFQNEDKEQWKERLKKCMKMWDEGTIHAQLVWHIYEIEIHRILPEN